MDRHVPSEPDAAPGLRERKRLQTLDLLTRSAYTLFETHGYDGVTMEQIAAQAGVSKGTLYNHFPVKALLAHYFHQELARSARDLLPRLMKLPGFAQRLTKTLHASAHWSEAHRAYMAPYLHYRLATAQPAAQDDARYPRSGMHTLFAALIESGQAAGELRTDLSAAQLAQHLQLLYLGALTRWLADPRASLKREFDAVVSLFTQGAGSPHERADAGLAAAADAGPRWPAAGLAAGDDGAHGRAGARRLRAVGPGQPRRRLVAVGAAGLRQALEARGWLDLPLALRSSAPQEDSAGASFAGIHLSCLNVRGADATFAAARRIWDSAATPQARAYRERLGLAGDGGMAVVVMPLIEARVSGIAFTRDPVGGRHDEMLIHANWGLGEALVSGQAEGDEYRLREDATTLSWRLAASRIGAKRQASRPLADGQGTGLRPTRDDEARAATLTPAQAEALGAIARDAARALDYSAQGHDLEWAWDGQRFWILQARPITAAARHA